MAKYDTQAGAFIGGENEQFNVVLLADTSGNVVSPGGAKVPTVVANNSSTDTLANGETYTGSAYEVTEFASVVVAVLTDQTGLLYIDFSPDGTNWDSTLTYDVSAGVNEVHRLSVTRQYFRVRFTNNSGSDQTYFRLQSMAGGQTALSAPLNLSVGEDADAIVTKSIPAEDLYVSGGFVDRFVVNKFGRNSDVDGVEDIWNGGATYTGFPTSGSAETVTVTSSAGATDSGLTVRLYGLDGDYNLLEETVTLNASGVGVSSNTFWRLSRAKVLTAASGQVTNVGNLTANHTTTTANVFMVLPAGFGQTQIAAYTIPAGYTGYVKHGYASMLDNTANSGIIALWLRELNSAERLLHPSAISTTFTYNEYFYGGITVPEKSDLKSRILSIENINADVTAGFDILLIKN